MKKTLILPLLLLVLSASTVFADNRDHFIFSQHTFYSKNFANQFKQNYLSQNDQRHNPELRVELNRAMLEHAALAALHLKLLFEEQDTSRSRELLFENGNKIVELITQEDNNDIRDQFMSLWISHIEEYERYTLALRNNDQQAMESSRESLNQISEDLGNIFSQDSDQIAEHMRTHVDLTLSIVDTFPQQDVNEMISRIKQGSDHAAMFADEIYSTLTR